MRTVEDLKGELRRRGRDPDVVARAEDDDAPRVDGMMLVRSLADGRSETAVWERGRTSEPAVFDSEQSAVSQIAEHALRELPAPTETAEERAASIARMQAKAQDTLRRLEQSDHDGDAR